MGAILRLSLYFNSLENFPDRCRKAGSATPGVVAHVSAVRPELETTWDETGDPASGC